MKILTIFLFFILGVTVQAEKLVISILDFKGEDVSEKILRASYQTLETSLIQSNRFTVVDKKRGMQFLRNNNFNSLGCVMIVV